MSKRADLTDIHNLELRFGPWIKDLPEDKILRLISITLNYCVVNEEIRIKGYLITKSHLYLVLIYQTDAINHILGVLSKKMAHGVYTHLGFSYDDQDEKTIHPSDQYGMFKKYSLQDYDLIKLITGKEVKLPFNSPKITYLKNVLHGNNYCSVQDYAGALGPVIVYTQ